MQTVWDPRPLPLFFRGLFAVVFGITTIGLTALAVLIPRITAGVLDVLFGGYALVDGIVAVLVAGWALTSRQVHPTILVRGICGIAAALVSFHTVIATPDSLARVISGWAIVTGLLDLGLAAVLGNRTESRRYWLIGGISVIFGLTLLSSSNVQIETLILTTGVYSLLSGALVLFFRRLKARKPDIARSGSVATGAR